MPCHFTCLKPPALHLRRQHSRLYRSVGCCLCPPGFAQREERMESPFRRRTTSTWKHPGHHSSLCHWTVCPSSGSTTWKKWQGLGISLQSVVMTASSFTREIGSSDHLETRPPVHHMQSVRGSLSGPGLGSGWSSLLPHPHRRQQAPRQCGWGFWDGVGSTLRSAGTPRHGSGWDHGPGVRRRQPTVRFHDICFGGGICRVRDGN